jgi:hypothetical protein
MKDEDVRLEFDPLFPSERWGSDPDGVLQVMRSVGFNFSDDEDPGLPLASEAAFALAEHITGVRLPPDLLRSARYHCAVVPVPWRLYVP